MSESSKSHEINALLDEARVFEPSPEWRAHARVTDPGVYERAAADPEAYWAEWAKKLDWIEPCSCRLLMFPLGSAEQGNVDAVASH